jgi:hypothetical protein
MKPPACSAFWPVISLFSPAEIKEVVGPSTQEVAMMTIAVVERVPPASSQGRRQCWNAWA